MKPFNDFNLENQPEPDHDEYDLDLEKKYNAMFKAHNEWLEQKKEEEYYLKQAEEEADKAYHEALEGYYEWVAKEVDNLPFEFYSSREEAYEAYNEWLEEEKERTVKAYDEWLDEQEEDLPF